MAEGSVSRSAILVSSFVYAGLETNIGYLVSKEIR